MEPLLVTDPRGAGEQLAARAGIDVRHATRDVSWVGLVTIDDIIVFDGYHLGAEMASVAAEVTSGVRTAAVDDFGTGHFPVDVVVCPNPLGDVTYTLKAGGVTLFGPRFAPVRASFRRKRRQRDPGTDLLLVSFGGADPSGLLQKTAAVIEAGGPFRDVCAVVGPVATAPPAASLRVLHNPADMAAVMDSANAAVIAAGSTVWEACTIGLAIIAVPVADNQHGITRALQDAGAAIVVEPDDAFEPNLGRAVTELAQPSTQHRLATAAMELVDGLGAERIVDVLLG